MPISRPSRPASTTCAPRTIQAAGRPGTTFRPRATGASSRKRFRAGCRRPLSTSSSTPDGRCSPTSACARRCDAVRLRMDQSQFLLRSLPAQRRAISTAQSFPRCHRPADARERALLAAFPDAVRPDMLDGTWSPPVSDGSGRDRATLRQALALFAEARLRAQRHRRCATRARGAPDHIRNHGHDPGRGAPRARLFAATSSAPASTPRCASSMPCNTTGAS